MTLNPEYRHSRMSVTPPPDLRIQLEQEVMRGIDRLPHLRRRRNTIISLGAAALAAILFIVPTRYSSQSAKENTDFLESVIVSDDHVFIWLDPIVTIAEARHE